MLILHKRKEKRITSKTFKNQQQHGYKEEKTNENSRTRSFNKRSRKCLQGI